MTEVSTPTMAGPNLALRFGLEMGALVGLAAGGWQAGSGFTRWVLAAAAPLAGAAVWATFNVPGDPSRSGNAPVVVGGGIRLAIELVVLATGIAALGRATSWAVAGVIGALTIAHYAVAWRRVRWLVRFRSVRSEARRPSW